MTAPADPLLETIAKALKKAAFDDSVEDEYGVAAAVLAALLSDAGSTQWGERGWNVDGSVFNCGFDEAHARAMAAECGGTVVRRQVLELHGDWENA